MASSVLRILHRSTNTHTPGYASAAQLGGSSTQTFPINNIYSHIIFNFDRIFFVSIICAPLRPASSHVRSHKCVCEFASISISARSTLAIRLDKQRQEEETWHERPWRGDSANTEIVPVEIIHCYASTAHTIAVIDKSSAHLLPHSSPPSSVISLPRH